MPSCPRCGAGGAAWVPGADDTDWCRMCGHADYHNPESAEELRAVREPKYRTGPGYEAYRVRQRKLAQARRARV